MANSDFIGYIENTVDSTSYLLYTQILPYNDENYQDVY